MSATITYNEDKMLYTADNVKGIEAIRHSTEACNHKHVRNVLE